MSRPYVPLGCTQQGRVTPTALQAAMNTDIEPWHLPHFDPYQNARVLDARQMELVTAGVPLPDLLLKTGCLLGPYRKTTPVTRWSLFVRRVWRLLSGTVAS